MSHHHDDHACSFPEELVTLRDWLRYAITRFNTANLHFGHGTDNAWDEAVYLLTHALHLPADRLDVFLDASLTHDEAELLAEVICKRAEQRMPAAYITGEAWLGEYRFKVDPRVIVPRSFFAELLRDQLSPWVPDPAAITRALDLCTGSGCLAILMAETFGQAHIDAVDLSADALAVAQENVQDYGLVDCITLYQSDVFANLPPSTLENRYDLIISNPPYVTDDAMAALPEEYCQEPAMALGAGADGLDIVRQILAGAKDRLTENGLLLIEVGYNRQLVEDAFPDLPMTWISTTSVEDAIFMVEARDLR